MATTFANAKTKIDEIASRMATNATRVKTAQTQVDAAVTDLNQMGAAYSQVVQDINAELAADPNNDAWKALKAEKDLLVSEFTTQKTSATALKTAMDGA